MKGLKINHLAVWTSVVALFVFGFLWYGPLFGEPWAKMVGFDINNMPQPGIGAWITNAVATIIPMYVMAWLFTQLGVESLLKGAGIGLLIGFAFVFLSKMTSDMFAKNPYALSWISGGADMVALAIGGAILGAWRKYEDS